MNISHHHMIVLGLLLVLTACGEQNPNEQVDEGQFDQRTFTSEEIGWQITIPEGWMIVTKEEAEYRERKGQELIEKSTGQNFDISMLKKLVSFQKDQFNVFQSTTDPFEEEFEGEWSQNNLIVREILLQAYQDNGIKAEASDLETEIVDGLEFNKLTIKITSPDNSFVMHQIMYNRLIHGLEFGVNINYVDQDLGHEMLEAWRASKFDIQ